MMIETPLRLGRGGNAREFHYERSRRVRKERHAVGFLLRQFQRPATPCGFVITRIAPGNGLDPHDNLPMACKSACDAIAEWMGVDDKRADVISYRFRQERGPWGLRIESTEWREP